MHKATIRVFYPLGKGIIVLRTEEDWKKDIEPAFIDEKSHCYIFEIAHRHPVLNYKPCMRTPRAFHWARGTNRLAILGDNMPNDIYPYFFSDTGGTITGIHVFHSKVYRTHRLLRAYLPEGYQENTLKRYSVVYMQDGKNLFFPQEAFLGQDWKIDENLDLLNKMNLTEQLIIVGVYAEKREKEYTLPGYERYGEFMTKEIVPSVDSEFRTLTGPWQTAVMGSSMGGVVSFYLAWQHPDKFGYAACLSSSFSLGDNLIERVQDEPLESHRDFRVYLDSGWPGDNYDVTIEMASALMARGFRIGINMVHFAFPLAEHSEKHWAERFHIPIQIFAGRLRRTNLRLMHPESFPPVAVHPHPVKALSKDRKARLSPRAPISRARRR
ncbi:MAG: alpha/beta hydrolase-fold protein [Candidatus Eremiobacteraeota bacterium]|nr:alpha/beta hydrolase-fold protein [Candidatus Eremiobacteraeota bacterium]